MLATVARTAAATKRLAVAAKSWDGGAGELKRCGSALGVSTGRALSKLICAVGLPAGLNQAIFASTANSAARTESKMPNAVSRECRIKKPPRMFNSLSFEHFWERRRRDWSGCASHCPGGKRLVQNDFAIAG